MKKLLIHFVIIFLFSSTASASPFLKWDPDTNCQTYNIYADGVLLAGGYETDNLNPSYDLVTMPNAGINYTVECCNYRGCSEVSDPFLSLDDPGKQMHLRLTP